MIGWLTSIGLRLKEGLRVLNPSIGVQVPAPELSSEVYDERQTMSAAAYVAHLRDAMDGRADPQERLAWSKYIVGLYMRQPDAYESFFFDVDTLIDQGELVYVPTPEERAEIQRAILDNIDHWRAEAEMIGMDYGIAPEAMHRLLNSDNTLEGRPLSEEDLLAVSEEEAEAWLEGAHDGDDDDCGLETGS